MTDRYAVFGNPIKHSLSPEIHKAFANDTSQDLTYSKEEIELSSFEVAVKSFFGGGGKGLNITVPFKERAYAISDRLSERARCAGAVNTLLMLNDVLYGDNTDGAGLLNDMQHVLGWELKNKRILLLGAGGASRGVLLPLLAAQPGELVIANRTQSKAHALYDQFIEKAEHTVLVVSALDDLNKFQSFDVIINSTSASLSNDSLSLPSNLCTTDTCFYDMVYAKEQTVFLQWAVDQGATQYADGLGMLLEQAAEAFFVWRGVRPVTDYLRKQLR